MIIEVNSEADMKTLGAKLGGLLKGGEAIELIGDVGVGKTTFTKGIAVGMCIDEAVQSPSFTISRLYDAPHDLHLAHYDFYRLQDAGIMANELHETLHDPHTVTVIEWAEIISSILPADQLTIAISPIAKDEHRRRLEITAAGERSATLLEKLV